MCATSEKYVCACKGPDSPPICGGFKSNCIGGGGYSGAVCTGAWGFEGCGGGLCGILEDRCEGGLWAVILVGDGSVMEAVCPGLVLVLATGVEGRILCSYQPCFYPEPPAASAV